MIEINIEEEVNKVIQVNTTGVLVPVLIPPDALIKFILDHSSNLVAFMPVFTDLSQDKDMEGMPNTQKVMVPANFNRRIIT